MILLTAGPEPWKPVAADNTMLKLAAIGIVSIGTSVNPQENICFDDLLFNNAASKFLQGVFRLSLNGSGINGCIF